MNQKAYRVASLFPSGGPYHRRGCWKKKRHRRRALWTRWEMSDFIHQLIDFFLCCKKRGKRREEDRERGGEIIYSHIWWHTTSWIICDGFCEIRMLWGTFTTVLGSQRIALMMAISLTCTVFMGHLTGKPLSRLMNASRAVSMLRRSIGDWCVCFPFRLSCF